MTTLDEIGLKYGTDKASNGHNYLNLYEHLIPHDWPISLLEIGWHHGASMRTWVDWCDQRSILVGVDIHTPDEREFGAVFAKADATNPAEILPIAHRYGSFDVIIDDGSHVCDDVTDTLSLLWPFVAPGGYYIVEDLQVAYHPQWGGKDTPYTHESSMGYLKLITDEVMRGHSGGGPGFDPVTMVTGVESVAFHPGVCVLRKEEA